MWRLIAELFSTGSPDGRVGVRYVFQRQMRPGWDFDLDEVTDDELQLRVVGSLTAHSHAQSRQRDLQLRDEGIEIDSGGFLDIAGITDPVAVTVLLLLIGELGSTGTDSTQR